MRRSKVSRANLILAIAVVGLLGQPAALAQPSKGTVTSGVALFGAVCSVFIPVACQISAAAHIFAINVANDISLQNHATDNSFAQSVVPSTLSLPASATDVPSFPNSVNVALNAAVNSELSQTSALLAAATATNRYFSALDAGDIASAQARQTQVSDFISAIDASGAEFTAALGSFATSLDNTSADYSVTQAAFGSFQSNLSANVFDPSELGLFAQLESNIDPVILANSPDLVTSSQNVLATVGFPESGGTPLSFADATMRAAAVAPAVSAVVGPFPVPEPASLIILGVALGGLAIARLRSQCSD